MRRLKSRRDLALLAVLAVVIALLAALSGQAAEQDARDARASSYLSTPGGTRALHEVLHGVNVPTRRLLRPLDDAPVNGALLVIAPTETMSPGELHALAEWVRRGGTLIYAAGIRDSDLRDTLGLRRPRRAQPQPGAAGGPTARGRARPPTGPASRARPGSTSTITASAAAAAP